MTVAEPLLEARGLGKRFGGSVALEGVDVSLRAGEVHGLVGANGAGKSTLSKILAGALPEHEGEIRIEGRPARLASPRAAREHGVAMVYQELSGVGALSVAENLFLGRQPLTRAGTIAWGAIREQAAASLAELGLALDVRRRLDRFPLVVRQMVEIARGLHSGAKVLILDEPTSALSPPETRRLFELLEQTKARGVAILFISHFLEEVLEVSDRVTVLRDGRRVLTEDASRLTKHAVIEAMLGHQATSAEPGYETGSVLPPRSKEEPLLEVQNLSLRGAFEGIRLEVAPGECLGLYGFVGAGHQDLCHAIAGAIPPDAGTVRVGGRAIPPASVSAAVRQGLVLVAADRARTLYRAAPVAWNVTLAHLRRAVGEWRTRGRELAAARTLVARVGCRPADPMLPAANLSGGNQQKIVLAKWLLGPVRVLVLEEPTRGMDVGAKEEVLALVRRLKKEGAAVLLASTEPELVLAHADRIAVFRRGNIAREFENILVDKADLLRHAS